MLPVDIKLRAATRRGCACRQFALLRGGPGSERPPWPPASSSMQGAPLPPASSGRCVVEGGGGGEKKRYRLNVAEWRQAVAAIRHGPADRLGRSCGGGHGHAAHNAGGGSLVSWLAGLGGGGLAGGHQLPELLQRVGPVGQQGLSLGGACRRGGVGWGKEMTGSGGGLAASSKL